MSFINVAVLVAFMALLSASAQETCTASYCEPCRNKDVGDCCNDTKTEGICIASDNGVPYGYKCALDEPFVFYVRCKLHSRNANLGCFSPAELTEASFVVCDKLKAGDACMAEGRSANITGNCIKHYDHGGLMCLEAVASSGDCQGLGLGQPCPVGAIEAGKLCAHHSRGGQMMCITPKTGTDTAIVCDEKEKGDFCGYIRDDSSHGGTSGYFEGVCHPHNTGHMMCADPETTDGITWAPTYDYSEGCDSRMQAVSEEKTNGAHSRSSFAFSIIFAVVVVVA